MKDQTIRIASVIVKGSAIISGLAAYNHILPAKWLPWAVLIYTITSAIKDAAVSAGDIADDGKRNNSFKP